MRVWAMKLLDSMMEQGDYLFQWRSYLPLAILPVAALEFGNGRWFLAAFGTTIEDRWDVFCLFVSLAGLCLRVLTIGFVPSSTSGRSTRQHRAVELNTTGMYSVVRHPLYVGNFIVFLGFVLTLKSVVFVLFATIAYIVYYERIMLVEEAFLQSTYGDEFRAWAAQTPTIIPRFRSWLRPKLSFSWRTALQREYHSVLLIGTVFFLSKLSEGLVLRQQSLQSWLETERAYVILLALCAIFYAGASYVRKRTNWLAVAGRGP
jgi:protein-S-isoprenylcysteine O-methyltransferase Ste14